MVISCVSLEALGVCVWGEGGSGTVGRGWSSGRDKLERRGMMLREGGVTLGKEEALS